MGRALPGRCHLRGVQQRGGELSQGSSEEFTTPPRRGEPLGVKAAGVRCAGWITGEGTWRCGGRRRPEPGGEPTRGKPDGGSCADPRCIWASLEHEARARPQHRASCELGSCPSPRSALHARGRMRPCERVAGGRQSYEQDQHGKRGPHGGVARLASSKESPQTPSVTNGLRKLCSAALLYSDATHPRAVVRA